MPVFNERETVATAVERVLAADIPVTALEIVLVDDGSTDGTRELLGSRAWPEGVRVVLHDRNRGKGAAVRTGLAAARGAYAVVVDADLELDAEDVGRLLPPLLFGEAEAVFGARRFPRGSIRRVRYGLGNKGVTAAANLLFGGSLSDIMTGYKAMPTALFRSLALRETGFGIEPEIVARLLGAGVSIHEVPVAYEPRTHKEGKKLTMVDGFRVLRTLLRCRLTPAPAH